MKAARVSAGGSPGVEALKVIIEEDLEVVKFGTALNGGKASAGAFRGAG